MSDTPPVTALDTPIERATIDHLPLATLDAWLTEIRERRLTMVRKVQAVRAAKKSAMRRDVVDKYAKAYQRLANRLDKLDEEIEKCEDGVQKLRALALQLDDAELEPLEDAEDVDDLLEST